MNASPRARGFTLVELIAVVAIMGVLATIAVYSVRKYVQHAKVAEAAEIVSAIKAGQEAYYDETFQYLQVDSSSNSPERFYPAHPNSVSGETKIQWGEDSVTSCTNCGVRYKALGVMPSAAVLFRYSCSVGATASDPKDAVTSIRATSPSPASPFAAMSSATQAYYVVNAVSDLDGNGAGKLMTVVVGSNLMGDLNEVNIGQ